MKKSNESDTRPKFNRLHSVFYEEGFVKNVLSRNALFIMAFESFRYGVQEHVKSYFWHDTKDGKDIYSPEYHKRFTGQKPYKSPFEESVRFFVDCEALSEDEFMFIMYLQELRNDTTHRMIKALIEDDAPIIDDVHLKAIINLSYKVDNWWIKNIEAGANPDLDEAVDSDFEGAASLVTYFLSECFSQVCKE